MAMLRVLLLTFFVGPRGAAGALPTFTWELASKLWDQAEKEVASLSYAKNEDFVCGAGNWGDGPQCDQWDQGSSPCWPSAMTISASWDTELMARWSEEMAQEFGRNGRGQLGPGINIARFAWNGRLGEYMSGEDPYFGAKMVAAMVTAYRRAPSRPLQTAKHYIPNTIETDRAGMTEVVDERTLFEVYYPPFAAAVDAGVSGVMCSYNLVQCTSGVCSGEAAYACANDDTLNKHLKRIMGFRGIVISDWDATKCQDEGAHSGGCAPGAYIKNDYAAGAGLDLEMPACQSFKGGVTIRAKEKATRLHWAYLVQGSQPPARRRLKEVDGFCCYWPKSGDVCGRCGGKGSIGQDACRARKGHWCGGGSSGGGSVNSSLPRAAAPAPSAPRTTAEEAHTFLGSSWSQVEDAEAGPRPTPAPKPAPKPAPAWSSGVYKTNPFGPARAAPRPARAPSSVVPESSAGGAGEKTCPDQGSNNYKSPCKLALAARIIAESAAVLKNEGGVLPLSKHASVALVGSEACAANPLAQGGGSGWNGFACNKVHKVSVKNGIAGLSGSPHVSCPQGGADNSRAASADVVLAVVTPKKASEGTDRDTLQLHHGDTQLIRKYTGMGKKVVVVMNAPGPMITNTWDAEVAALVVSWLPGQQNGRGIAMALYGESHEASGRLPFTFPKCSTSACSIADERASVPLGDKIDSKEYLKFSEKALIGYRWYHAMGKEVQYPFGFGLFAYGSAQVKYDRVRAAVDGSAVTITAELSHSGPRSGRDVPQLYLSFPKSIPGDAESKPEWVLKGFTKVLLEPDTPKLVTFKLTERDLSWWDDAPGMSVWVCASDEFRVCVGANARDAVRDPRGAACTAFTPQCRSSRTAAMMQMKDELGTGATVAPGPGRLPWYRPLVGGLLAVSAALAAILALAAVLPQSLGRRIAAARRGGAVALPSDGELLPEVADEAAASVPAESRELGSLLPC